MFLDDCRHIFMENYTKEAKEMAFLKVKWHEREFWFKNYIKKPKNTMQNHI